MTNVFHFCLNVQKSPTKLFFSGDAHLSNLRSSAYEAVMDLVKNSPKDVYQAITQTFGAVLEKMVAILKMEEQGKQVGDYSQHNDFKSLLCATLQVCNLYIIYFNQKDFRTKNM